jgi:hypothetical protein
MLDLLISYMNLFIISLSYIIKRLTFQPPNPPGYVIHKNTKNNKEEIFFLVQSKKQNRYEKKQFNGINIEYINLFNKIKIKAELLLIKPHKHFPICIIYCHGNCGDIGYALYDCYLLAKNTNCIVLSFEFPSYGILKDLPFSEINTYKSIQIAYIYANKFLNINAKNIILYGFSLGTGIAFDLACKKKFPIGGLILQSPYLSIFRVVYDGKKSPFFDIFKNCDKAHKLKALTLFIHGNKDKIVPYVHGRILAKIIPSGYSSRTTEKESANSPELTEPYWEPTAIATPVRFATLARPRLISFTPAVPPVIASINTGAARVIFPTQIPTCTASGFTGVRQLCRKCTSSKPVLRFPSPPCIAYRI